MGKSFGPDKSLSLARSWRLMARYEGFVRDLVVDLAVLVVMCVMLLTAIILILIFGGALKSDTVQEPAKKQFSSSMAAVEMRGLIAKERISQ